MVYECYLDDSKDKNQSKLMVSAGFLGSKADWASLRSQWKAVLKRHGMEYFKSSEYNWLSGQFEQYRTSAYPKPKGREAAQQVRSELQDVLHRHPRIAGIGIMVLLAPYNRVLSRPEAKEALPTNPYCTALNSVIFETVKRVRKIPGHNMVEFVHDAGEDADLLKSSYEAFRGLNPITAKYIGGFSLLDDRGCPPLQLADMVSNYTMRLGLDGLQKGDMRAKLKEMNANIMKLGFWDENYMLSVLKHKLVTHKRPIPVDLQDDAYD